MNLYNTENLMFQKEQNNEFDSYGVLVSINDHQNLITSGNVDKDTYFDVASMGKVLVTSTLILKAMGISKLGLNHKLQDFFGNVPDEKRNITIKQLLTHTSGIVRINIPQNITALGNDAIASHILAAPLAFSPGDDYTYSCNGYILLGFILEKIFGTILDVIFDTYIKKPLELMRSCFNIAIDEPNGAICYNRKDVGLYRVDDQNVYNMKGIAGSGASFWSIADIQKFIEAVLRKDEILYPQEMFELAEQDYTPSFREGRGLGYEFVDDRYTQTGTLFPPGSFGHCGHTGMSFFVNRQKRLYAIVLTNTTRHLNIKSGFTGYDYNDTIRMRTQIHNEIKRDLLKQGL